MRSADVWARTGIRAVAVFALTCAVGAVALLVAVSGLRSVLVVAVGLGGTAVAAAATWWTLTRRGPARAAGVVLALAAFVVVLGLYAWSGLWWAVVAALAMWAAGLSCGRFALRRVPGGPSMRAAGAAVPQRPVLIMNPRSGGGKVARFGLVERGKALGAEVVLLDTSTHQDVSALARRAVADGADLLGVAGGDGTQALVAEVAAEYDLPFLVVPAGTRNHFAMDLGLDRADPSRALDALKDGVELRVDLGQVAGRPFVNTVSFGAYAEIVQSSRYRVAKSGTALDQLPDLLVANPGVRLDAMADGTSLHSQQALLVSNNPYLTAALEAGRRAALDKGTLGVVGVRVDGAAQAAELALRGTRASALRSLNARRVVVTSEQASIPVAIDGEALRLPTPITCGIRQGVLRVAVPRQRPGPPSGVPMGWRNLVALARGRVASDVTAHRRRTTRARVARPRDRLVPGTKTGT